MSFLSHRKEEPWRLHASTLPVNIREGLIPAISGNGGNGTIALPMAGQEYEARVAMIEKQGDTQIVAVLQRSLAEGIEPFKRVSKAFLILAVAAIMLSVIGSIAIARNITRPINELAGVARRIQDGDYAQTVDVEQKGEIGALAASFNHMLLGIATREKENLRLAFEDHLTGLPNRAMFHDRLANE